MRKIGFVIAGAVLFDLGTIVASSQAAAVDYFLKIDGIKTDKVSATDCMTRGGAMTTSGGVAYCEVTTHPKTGAGAVIQDLSFTHKAATATTTSPAPAKTSGAVSPIPGH